MKDLHFNKGMKNKINYLLGDAGWATLKIVTDSKTFEFDISYLYDSLSELSSSAVKLNGSVSNYSVSFMSEPGTFKMDLIKNKKNRICKRNRQMA